MLLLMTLDDDDDDAWRSAVDEWMTAAALLLRWDGVPGNLFP